MTTRDQIIESIKNNPYYDWEEKNLWLKNLESIDESQFPEILSHFQNLQNRVDNLPSNNQKIQSSLLEVIGRMHNKEAIQTLTQTFSPEDQEFTDEEWTSYLENLTQTPEEMVKFFATIGPQGLKQLGEIIFQSYLNKELNIEITEFTKIMSAITGLKQLLEKANREYMEEIKTIYLQELERKQIEDESSLKRAEELINNFLNTY